MQDDKTKENCWKLKDDENVMIKTKINKYRIYKITRELDNSWKCQEQNKNIKFEKCNLKENTRLEGRWDWLTTLDDILQKIN